MPLYTPPANRSLAGVSSLFEPQFKLPPAPGFGRGFDNPFGVFTDFQPTGGIDESIMNLLRQKAERDTITGFIPDQADFDANLAAQMDEIFARAGLNREQLAADISARGIGGAGEIPRTLVRDIQGPAVRAAATVSAQAQLAFQEQVQTGAIAQEGALGASRGQLLDAAKTNAQLASMEAQFGANLESNERMAANRNALTKAMHDDNITLETFKTMLNAQLQEYLAQMRHYTATQVAHIQAAWQSDAASDRNKTETMKTFLKFVVSIAVLLSDREMKTDVHASEVGLAEVIQLSPSTFTWITNDDPDTGLIAQEVAAVIPDAVTLMPDGKHLGIRPMTLIAALINSVKELKAEIEELKAR